MHNVRITNTSGDVNIVCSSSLLESIFISLLRMCATPSDAPHMPLASSDEFPCWNFSPFSQSRKSEEGKTFHFEFFMKNLVEFEKETFFHRSGKTIENFRQKSEENCTKQLTTTVTSTFGWYFYGSEGRKSSRKMRKIIQKRVFSMKNPN